VKGKPILPYNKPFLPLLAATMLPTPRSKGFCFSKTLFRSPLLGFSKRGGAGTMRDTGSKECLFDVGILQK
jgi:hypothetical protein